MEKGGLPVPGRDDILPTIVEEQPIADFGFKERYAGADARGECTVEYIRLERAHEEREEFWRESPESTGIVAGVYDEMVCHSPLVCHADGKTGERRRRIPRLGKVRPCLPYLFRLSRECKADIRDHGPLVISFEDLFADDVGDRPDDAEPLQPVVVRHPGGDDLRDRLHPFGEILCCTVTDENIEPVPRKPPEDERMLRPPDDFKRYVFEVHSPDILRRYAVYRYELGGHCVFILVPRPGDPSVADSKVFCNLSYRPLEFPVRLGESTDKVWAIGIADREREFFDDEVLRI